MWEVSDLNCGFGLSSRNDTLFGAEVATDDGRLQLGFLVSVNGDQKGEKMSARSQCD